MGAFFTTLFSKLSAIVGWFGALGVKIFESGWHLITDAFCWIVDQFLTVAVNAVGSLDVSGITPYGNVWAGAPGEVLNVLGLIGVGEALSIITAAIVIRLTLQTIPFVRWGS